MKIAVIGAKGMLGSDLCRVLASEHKITAWDFEEIDITDREAARARLQRLRPQLIANTAAFVDVEACEENPDTAWRINAVGAQNLALAARAMDCAYLLISTDYIFDGQTEADYDELALPNPLNHYGRSKLAAETLSRQICPSSYFVRTAWLFGHRPNNYVERVLRLAEREGVVKMPVDQIESPTYTVHLAEAILRLISTGAFGTYNVTSQGACTRVEFARYVLAAVGRTEPVETVDASGLKRTARRPYRSVLDCRLFRLVTGHALPPWQKGVDDYLAAAGLAAALRAGPQAAERTAP